jgi:GT2 family glycosyltransferase/2-polyprenyl-3-methyl-5-hydroxy-6-metoxy-1,4-benzoquinol methylase
MFEADSNVYDSPLNPEDSRDSRSVAVRLVGKNKFVLELGPAMGRVTRALKDNGCEVIAIERDPHAVEALRKICTVIEGDIEQLPLDDYLDKTKFDVILAGDFLEHLQDPTQLLKELRPHLSANGYLVSSIPNVSHGSVRMGLLHGKFDYRDTGILDRTHLRFFTLQSIRAMFSEAGYEIQQVQRLTADPFAEPMTGEPVVDPQTVSQDVRRLIEDDAEALTVQFVVIARAAPEQPIENISRKPKLGSRLLHLENESAQQQKKIQQMEAEREGLVRQLGQTQATLEDVINSIGWRALNRFRDLRGRYFPTGSLRHKAYLRVMRPVRAKLRAAPLPEEGPKAYDRWIETHEIAPKNVEKEIASFAYRPTISVITPVFNPEIGWLRKCLDSVLAQSYGDWQLCLCDDASTDPAVLVVLREYARRDPRVRLHSSTKNQGISLASNEALALADGEYVALLDHDDELSPHALYWAVKLLQEHRDADIIYSDEDKLELDGRRSDPFFKPEWSPEYLQSCMYTGHLTFYRRSLVESIGGFRAGFEGSQDYDLMLRASRETTAIYHIPKILYHWRKAEGSAAARWDAKPYAYTAAKRVLADYAARKCERAEVVEGACKGQYRIRYPVKEDEKVSVIIPTRDKVRILKVCVDSIALKTTHKNYEIIIVDNNSKEAGTLRYFESIPHRVLRFEGEFNFSAINNFAARQASGKYLLFLNNDTEVITPEWMTAMLEWAQQPEIGAVGAKLIYPNQTIQHVGVVLGFGGVAGHALAGQPKDTERYFSASQMTRNWSAVTAACMMMRREVFEAVGGFDEELKVAFNDVDLCLRIRQLGLRNLVTPYAQLYHHESASRGFSLDPVEVGFMKSRWGALLSNDPFYNPNLTLHNVNCDLRW